MVYKEREIEDATKHWLVFYRTKSGRLGNMTVDSDDKCAAMHEVRNRARSFKDFERGTDGAPIIKRKVYAHEIVWS